MITYKEIGHFGRLGNQLFQFASTYGIAKKLGYDVKFPIENMTEPSIEDFKDGIRREITFDVPKCFNIPDDLLCSKKELDYIKINVQEPYFHFCENVFSIPDNKNIIGYYQTEKYFKHVENDLKNILSFKNKLSPYFIGLNTVSIHIRVGDYAGLQQFHPICSSEYYISALENFTDQEYTFLIFSDDIEYTKNMFGDQDNLIYIEGNDPYTDLQMMSLCNHNIIANSSFSWWAAWLNKNPNKKVVAPKNWFGPAYEGVHNTKDLYPESWIIV
jgi:hypothetical protein